MSALEIRRLATTTTTTAVLHDVDLTVTSGEVHALIGFNGAGKSTLMRAALGMIRPAAGIVRIDGVDVGRAPRQRCGGAWAR